MRLLDDRPGPAAPVDRRVRFELARRYAEIAAQFPDAPNDGWRERLAAAAADDVLVEPGWMLRPIVGDDVDIHGLYRVYGDGRIERDRFIERQERARFLGAHDVAEES
jgi:hypothetical protein